MEGKKKKKIEIMKYTYAGSKLYDDNVREAVLGDYFVRLTDIETLLVQERVEELERILDISHKRVIAGDDVRFGIYVNKLVKEELNKLKKHN